MRHMLLLAEFLSIPWAMEPGRLQIMSGVVARWAFDVPRAMEDYEDYDAVKAERARRQATPIGGGVAQIPIYGAIVQRADMFSDMSGATSTQRVSSQLADALADETVGSILLDVDSPGGSVLGISELADEIRAANQKKPVVAIANAFAASGAYWLGSQAGELYVTPSGQVGSIGVYAAHDDVSKALEQIGVKTTLISAGKYKTESASEFPLSDEAKAHIQKTVNTYYQQFTSAVARGRNVGVAAVRGGMGEGRMLTADDAKAAGMVDGVQTYAATVKGMQRKLAVAPAARSAARARAIGLLERE